jgi:hypothetical protein
VRYDFGKIDIRQHIAVEHNGSRINVFFGILKRASGAKGRAFYRISDPYAVIRAIFEQVLDLSWLVGQTENDLVDACASHQIYLK